MVRSRRGKNYYCQVGRGGAAHSNPVADCFCLLVSLYLDVWLVLLFVCRTSCVSTLLHIKAKNIKSILPFDFLVEFSLCTDLSLPSLSIRPPLRTFFPAFLAAQLTFTSLPVSSVPPFPRLRSLAPLKLRRTTVSWEWWRKSLSHNNLSNWK